MKNRMMLTAGIAGIGLAFILFPKPDTGNELLDPIPGEVRFDKAPDPRGDPEAPKARMPDRGGKGAMLRPEQYRRHVAKPPPGGLLVREDGVRRGSNPFSKENFEKRNTPEGIYAGRLSAPVSLIRRQLLLEGSDAAKAEAEALVPLITDLRDHRRAPNEEGWPDLEQRVKALAAELDESPFMEDEIIGEARARLDTLVAEYQDAKANQANASNEE